jgi:hypothetical protein
MIVRVETDSYLLITQPTHAALARRIMAASSVLLGHPRRDDILLAIGEHDSGWLEEDAAPTVDASSGAIVDFISAPLGTRQAWPGRGVSRLASTSPYAAALVAEHGLTVYARLRSEPAWLQYFADLEARRAALLDAAGTTVETLQDDYGWVRVADLMSLAFCTEDGPQTFRQWTVARHGDAVRVEPPTLGIDTGIQVVATRIARRLFTSHEDLRAAIAQGTSVTFTGTATA